MPEFMSKIATRFPCPAQVVFSDGATNFLAALSAKHVAAERGYSPYGAASAGERSCRCC